MEAADILIELHALGVRVVVEAGGPRPCKPPPWGGGGPGPAAGGGRPSLCKPLLWGAGDQGRLDAVMPHLRERRAAVVALCSRTTDRPGMRRALDEMDDLVAASGVSGAGPEVQAVAGRALELFDA